MLDKEEDIKELKEILEQARTEGVSSFAVCLECVERIDDSIVDSEHNNDNCVAFGVGKYGELMTPLKDVVTILENLTEE